MNELVSIIMPTFNRAHMLAAAIESVRAQTYGKWELIIVDDGSTDNTKLVVESYNDDRIRYVFQENAGPSVARNTGLIHALGAYISFLDSDNEFLPHYLEKAISVFAQHPEIVCIVPKGNRTLELYENDVLIEKKEVPSFPPNDVSNVAKEIFMRTFIFDMNAFIHRASVRDEGVRFDPNMRGMEDWDYALSIAQAHPDGFLYLPEPLYNYHQRYGGDGLVSNTSYARFADLFEQIYQKHEHDSLMRGQTWYPERVEKWRKIQADFEKGIEPPPHLYRFKK